MRFKSDGPNLKNVGCGAQCFFVDIYFQQAVPSTADPRKGSLQPIVLQHPHTKSMDEYWDSTEIVLEQYRKSIGRAMKQYWSSTGTVLKQTAVLVQYWNSLGPILKQYWNNSLPENLSRISQKDPGSQPAKKRSPTHA